VRFQAAVPGGIKEQQFRRPALFGAPADGYAVHERYARRPSLEPDRYALDVDGETQTEQLRRRSIKSYTAGKVNSTWFDEDGNDKSEFVNELRKYEANFKNRFEVANAKRKELEKNYNALELSDGSNIHSMMVTELAKSMQATRQQLAELQNEKAKNERAEAVGSEGIEARVWAMQQDRYLSKSPQRGVQTSAIKMRLLESEANAELVRQKVGTGHPDYEAAIGTVKIIEQQLAETKKGIAAPSVDDAIAPEVVFARKKSEVEQKIKDLTRSLTEQDEQWTLHNKEAMRLSKAKQELASLDAELAEIREAQRLGGEMLLKLDSTGEREQYAPIYENQFVQATGGAAVSTFSIDVDTASYANMRRFLNSGQMPPRDSIRIEELVNYFQYDYPQPKGDDPFSVNMELATCPWNDAHKLLRVGLKGKEVHVKERPATNVVYLIDVSGSMSSNDKLPLLKRGFQMMTKQLGKNDRVSIVTYAGNAGVALKPTTGDKTETINEAIENLTSGGSTHGSAGIELAYKLAQQHFITGGVNKVILATDGDLNVGVTADGALVKLIKQKASEGVFLTVLGFGTGNLQDGKLEKLADNGNGHYAYIDSNREAHRVLVQQVSGSLVTIAKDVKIQIEFNPAEVKSYRLVGYENRMLETKDFDDDRKDAGEIGAGHTVTAIYEIEPMSSVKASFTAPKGMKYQTVEEDPAKSMMKTMRHLTGAATTGELATLALRYKKPDENESKRIEFAIKNDEKSFTSASDDFRFAASVAGFGMLLRGSEHAGDANPAMILEMASDSMGEDTTGYRAEFIDLVRPFVPKDHILGAAFKRDDTVAIALGGFFDLDGDGVSDLEKLKRMLARNGGRVVAFHDENGKVIGKIEATTRFFVLGPTPRSGSPEVFETMAKMKEQAEAKSVEVIDLRKLLNWTGIPGSSKIERMDSRIGENTGFESRSTAEK
jgi:Ca-activated chloride channel family protein